jgi:outer membrane protein OmpA-like peptidoglycan-associated protein
VYPGEEVTVNPAAAGTQVLLYPGGKYMRVVPPLRQPGEAYGPMRLHMPVRHRLARTSPPRAMAAAPAAPVQSAPPDTTPSDFGDVAVARQANPAPAPTRVEPRLKPAPVRTPPPERVARSEPPPQRAARVEPPPVRTPPPQRAARSEPPPVRTPPPQRVARVEPPPARTLAPAPNPEADSGSRRGIVLFAPNATDPSISALQSVKALAGSLGGVFVESSSRVQLLAFGGQRGEKTSDTRRLSLKRALIVRQLLIDNGVPSERIDVRAMGGTDDDGPLDRVDVFLRS